MTANDGRADETATDGDEEDDEPPYSKLDEKTAAKCGLWQ